MKKVLVLGAGGFIGSHLVEVLLRTGQTHVIAADIKEGFNWANLREKYSKTESFMPILRDFTDPASFLEIPKQVDEVYMLAAMVGVNKTLKNPEKVIDTNTRLTMNTLSWIEANPVKRLLFASSSENYAGTSDLFDTAVPTDESVPLCISDIRHPRWTYAVSKIHGESAFYHSASALGYDCTIVRYQNIIGPNMGFGHAIPHIVERFCRPSDGGPFMIYGHDQTRSFCFVEDAVAGTIGAMERDDNKDSEIYHIGAREEISIRELTQFIGRYLGYSGEYQNAQTYPGSVGRRCPDIVKATTDFGYSPQYHWKEAVRLTVDWYRDFFESGKSPSQGGFEPPEMVYSSGVVNG